MPRVHGNSPYDAACVKCGRICNGKPRYAARVKRCGTWVAGCRLCFVTTAQAKPAVRAAIDRIGCGCLKCAALAMVDEMAARHTETEGLS